MAFYVRSQHWIILNNIHWDNLNARTSNACQWTVFVTVLLIVKAATKIQKSTIVIVYRFINIKIQ